MKVIGITGGVGSGKTEVLSYITSKYHARVLYADTVANTLKEPGEPCYKPVVTLLGAKILDNHSRIDKQKMAERIFSDAVLLEKVNALVHPAVKQYILAEIKKEKERNSKDFFFVEAALLIENQYDEICDELWYIYADRNIRKDRLRKSRNYSDEKIENIMAKQLSEDEFKRHCKVFIDNSGDLEETYKKLDEKLGEYLCQN